MSTLISIKNQLAAKYNATHGTSLKFSELEVRAIAMVDNTYPVQFRTKNTVITLGHDDKNVNVVYDRISLLTRITIPEAWTFALPKTANGKQHQLLPYLSKRLGVELFPEDFDDDRYTIGPALTSITFRVSKTSLRWIPGEDFTITLGTTYRLKNGVCEADPISLNLSPDPWQVDHDQSTTNNGSRVSPTLLTMSVDYTPVAHILSTFGAFLWANDNRLIKSIFGTHGKLAAALASIDKIPWQISASAAPFNLYNAWCVYNGPSKHAKGILVRGYVSEASDVYGALDVVNEEFDNVMVIRLDYTLSPNTMPCMAFFHYNNTVKKGRSNANA